MVQNTGFCMATRGHPHDRSSVTCRQLPLHRPRGGGALTVPAASPVAATGAAGAGGQRNWLPSFGSRSVSTAALEARPLRHRHQPDCCCRRRRADTLLHLPSGHHHRWLLIDVGLHPPRAAATDAALCASRNWPGQRTHWPATAVSPAGAAVSRYALHCQWSE